LPVTDLPLKYVPDVELEYIHFMLPNRVKLQAPEDDNSESYGA
jgi:hypothetical protein